MAINVFKPVHGRLLVDRKAKDSKSFGGVFVPEGTAVDPFVEATVVESSEGYRNDFGNWVPSQFEAGDRVIVGHGGGIPIRLNGRELILLREQEIFGFVIQESGDTENKDASNVE